MSPKKRVLILCTGNSCRSQMAEGWINDELGETWQARSAGTRPAKAVHPAGRPRLVDVYLDEPWELVITVCDSAREACPVFPRPVETLHISFPDPAEAEGSNEEVMEVFRTVRDAIRDRLLPEIRNRSV